MPLTVVVGGQFGSEGKGKLVSHLCRKTNAACAIRTGGPNAGHTVNFNGIKHVSRVLPSGYTNPNTDLVIGAGGIVDVEVLRREVTHLSGCGYGISHRLFIDRAAAVVPAGSVAGEIGAGLGERVGSTLTGTGWTQVCRILRDPANMKVASECDDLRDLATVCDVTKMVNEALDTGQEVIIEGTQGFGLSLYHGPQWPYCTSRDTSAAGFVSEAGLSPLLVSDVFMVLRTWPIRVGGNSGPMRDEVDWKTVHQYRGVPSDAVEMTSVTGKVRRVGRFDWALAQRAALVNRPTALAVHGLDYVCGEDSGRTRKSDLSRASLEWLEGVEERLETEVAFAYTGPRDEDIIDMTRY